jgi:TRAP-type mannitol/chloroaromatic compound transport system substrate-binding protein
MFGWFNKEINSLDDIKGLKMRFPGFGREVFKRAGGIPVKYSWRRALHRHANRHH